MAEARIDPIEQIPDADLLEQQTPTEPVLKDERSSPAVHRDATILPADEADLVEQDLTLPNSDDEYPHAASSGREHDA